MCLISPGILSFSFAVSVTPTPPVTVNSTVRLAAQVSPSSIASWGTWVSPSGEQLHTEISHGTGSLLSKLPRVTSKDNGVYTCRIRVHGNSGTSVSEHRVNVTVNGEIWRYFLKTCQSDKLLSQCYLLKDLKGFNVADLFLLLAKKKQSLYLFYLEIEALHTL